MLAEGLAVALGVAVGVAVGAAVGVGAGPVLGKMCVIVPIVGSCAVGAGFSAGALSRP